jgi:hypothetical protein
MIVKIEIRRFRSKVHLAIYKDFLFIYNKRVAPQMVKTLKVCPARSGLNGHEAIARQQSGPAK